jgi:hypothetical protein
VTEKIISPVFRRLDAFKVNHWGEHSGDMSVVEREVTPVEGADVISSRLKIGEVVDAFTGDGIPNQHIVVLDIDHLAHLIPSTTPGHSHLIVEIPPVAAEVYFKFLRDCAEVGLIEPGYAEVSIQRGHSDVRLPWVKKPEIAYHCCRCGKEPTELNEYRMAAWGEKSQGEPGIPEPTDAEVLAYFKANEGTLNRRNGLFACTDCYIAMGQPSGPHGWTPNGPDSIQPLDEGISL